MKKSITIIFTLLFIVAGRIQAQDVVRSLEPGTEKVTLDKGVRYKVNHTKSDATGSYTIFRDGVAVGTYPETTLLKTVTESGTKPAANLIDKSKFRNAKLPTDSWEPQDDRYDVYGLENIWDGIEYQTKRWEAFMSKATAPMPQWFTIDLGQTVRLNNFRLFPRNCEEWAGWQDIYSPLFPRSFEVWGSNNPNADGSFDESWTLLGRWELKKSNGFDGGENPGPITEEDAGYFCGGQVYEFEANAEFPNAYMEITHLRFKTLNTGRTLDGTEPGNSILLAEITLYGEVVTDTRPAANLIDKSKFTNAKLPTDSWEAQEDRYDVYGLENLWDGVEYQTKRWEAFMSKETSPMPQWFTINLGQTVRLNNFRLFPRNCEEWANWQDIYSPLFPRSFEVWGSSNPNADGSFDESWTLLGRWELKKSNGFDGGENPGPITEEDAGYFCGGQVYEFEKNEEFPNAYMEITHLRFKTLNTGRTLDGTFPGNSILVAEITLYGEVVE
jgi:hypothetical protein